MVHDWHIVGPQRFCSQKNRNKFRPGDHDFGNKNRRGCDTILNASFGLPSDEGEKGEESSENREYEPSHTILTQSLISKN